MFAAMLPIKTIVVCGAGTMGSGIAQVAAHSGFEVIQFDLNGAMLEKSRAAIEKNFDFLISKQKLDTDQKHSILKRIVFTDAIAECKGEVVVEAIIESKGPKVGLFNKL